MKVICIEGGKIGKPILVGGEVYPKEGEIYTAYQHYFYGDCYDLEEMPPNKNGKRVGYQKIRFVPLSNIDEMELLEQREALLQSL